MNRSGTDLTGAILSRRFRLLKKLGAGGMGSVYAAEVVDTLPAGVGLGPGASMRAGALLPPGVGAFQAQERSLGDGGGGRVAIKILHPEFLGELPVLARFLEEGRVCQRLVHPNILRVFETDSAEDGSPYLVMELLEGVPLSAYTENGGRVPAVQAVPILQGILAGLATAHAQGVVHRDLKPDNVFLARDAKGQFVVKVLDFGIAKVMDAAGGIGAKTKTGMLLGTPAYMSPEQVRNAKNVDGRADLWSAGVMFYEMVSGRVAFAAPTEYARLSAIVLSEPEPIEQIDPKLGVFAPFLQKALAKDRDARFSSALEMARALAGASAGEEGRAARDGRDGRDGTDGREQRASVPFAPLAHLPEVPGVFVASHAFSQVQALAPASTGGREAATPLPAMLNGPHGTLASPAEGSLRCASERPVAAPSIVMVSGIEGGTLPSENLPMLAAVGPTGGSARRGIAPAIVVALVLVALAVGFVAGIGFARSQ